MKFKTINKRSFKEKLDYLENCPHCQSKLFCIDVEAKSCSSCDWTSIAMESLQSETCELSVIKAIEKFTKARRRKQKISPDTPIRSDEAQKQIA